MYTSFLSYLASRDLLFCACPELWLHVDSLIPTQTWFIKQLCTFFPSTIAGQSMHTGGETALAEAGVAPNLNPNQEIILVTTGHLILFPPCLSISLFHHSQLCSCYWTVIFHLPRSYTELLPSDSYFPGHFPVPSPLLKTQFPSTLLPTHSNHPPLPFSE